MSKIELLLRSQLIKDTLSSVLAEAGFIVFSEPRLRDSETIVIIDINECRDLEAIRHQSRGAKIVALASDVDFLEVGSDEIAALSGGLTYDLSADDFVRSLRIICLGERVFPADPARAQSCAVPSHDAVSESDEAGLSSQEKELLFQVLEGHSNEIMAQHLRITEAEAKAHFKRLLRKIKVDNRTQAAIWALANLPELDITRRGFV